MNHNMFAALLFAMLSGMHPEETVPEGSNPPDEPAAAQQALPETEHPPVLSAL